MNVKARSTHKENIVVGRPLPFSVFGAGGQLLLAEGSLVENDRARQLLLRQGVYRDSLGDEIVADAHSESLDDTAGTPLVALQRDYGAASAGRRFALSVASSDSDEPYNTWVIGLHQRSIILSAPRRADGSLVSVAVGHTWLCRVFQMTSAFRFRSTVRKVVFEPYPHVHIDAPEHVERRTVRGQPRAAVFLDVALQLPEATTLIPAVVVDLSLSGGRLAVEQGVALERGQLVRVGLTIELIDSRFDLSLKASVIARFGTCDGRHPNVSFFGLKFESLSEVERLVLHSFVSGQLALELNSLWQMLSSASPVNA